MHGPDGKVSNPSLGREIKDISVPKQYYHGFSQTLYYTPTLIIRVNDFNEEIDERLLKATDQLILLKRQPTILTNYTLLHQHSTNHNDPNKNTQHATQDQTT